MKTKLFSILCGLVVLVAMTSAQGAIVYYEPFDYSTGDIHGSATGWTNTGNTVGVGAGSLSYGDLVTSGNHAKYQNIGAGSGPQSCTKTVPGVAALFNSTSQKFYASWLFGDTATPSNNSPHCNWWIMRDDGVGGYIDDGITLDTTGGASIRANIHQYGTGENGASNESISGTKLMVLRFQMAVGSDNVRMIVNPNLATLSDSDFDFADQANGELTVTENDLDRMILYFATAGVNSQIDELRIGTEIADVIPVPEPATLIVLGLGLVPVLLRRRR